VSRIAGVLILKNYLTW